MQDVVIKINEKQDFRMREAYKTLRTNLGFSGRGVKVIALTSCTPSEGKTSTSLQLALSLAEAGKKTVLVDADLRKSVMKVRYKASRGQYGLSHYLSGQAALEDTCCNTNIENFHIIFAGPVPPNPSELLGNEAFRIMIQQLRGEYDYVIIDTPPLGSVIDGAVVARECDGVVIVIEANAVSYRFAQSVKDQLVKAGCNILGCVLNKVNLNQNSYYGKYYGKYYGQYYGNEGGEEIPLQASMVKKKKKEAAPGEKPQPPDRTVPEKKDAMDTAVSEKKDAPDREGGPDTGGPALQDDSGLEIEEIV